jgi:galactokinase
MTGTALTASDWATRLNSPDGGVLRKLHAVYGTDADVLGGRLALLRAVVEKFLERFGDRPLRLFRSPGRINLRGMHVDTHGGYLNLMTHQRESVAAVAPEKGPLCTFANTDPRFPDVTFDIREHANLLRSYPDWRSFIMAADERARVCEHPGHWKNYVVGAVCRAQYHARDRSLPGMTAVVGGDIPLGAALSSSAALCVSLVLAVCRCGGCALEDTALITAARDAEWYTGSRCGLSDQAAMVLPARGELVNVSIGTGTWDASAVRRMAFPDALRILVINSYTERSLSGPALVEYTRNRFAYSLAIEIVRQEMRAKGLPGPYVSGLDGLPRLSPDAFAEAGTGYRIFDLLRRIPETITMADLRARYDLPGLDDAYEQYFGAVPEALRPATIGLRGPLLFGIAESERARLFFAALAAGEYERAGTLMNIGHDGDRRVCADGTPYCNDVSDAALDALAASCTPIECCPGAYGASSPVLDALVDAATQAGALGASLTGAGIAGSVLALCRAEDADRVTAAVRERLASPEYARVARGGVPLSHQEIADGCIVNCATARAGELTL